MIGTPLFYFIVYSIVFLLLPLQLFKVAKVPAIRLQSVWVKIVFSLLLASFVFGISVASFWFLILRDLPPAEALSQRSIDVSTKILDRNGELLFMLYRDKNRTLVSLDEVPAHVRLATIAAEDASFYSHPGISIRGISRAVVDLATEGKITGGSTITQQLVKNALLSPDKTVARKLREVLIAIAVEQKYTKDQILEMYLNEVSYGGTNYGIQEASRQYFDKNVSELSLAEAALLAGLPKSPSILSPFGPRPGASLWRQREVLDLMRANGFISEEQELAALEEELKFAAKKVQIKAPHFVMHVREKLAEKYGEDYIYAGGLLVYTTLDPEIQNLTEQTVRDELDKISHLGVENGAALVVNPKTGEILSMVGSKDYFDENIDGNVNVVFSPRPPGSSIKAITYAAALSENFTPATVIDDSPSVFHVAGQKPYTPRNYDSKFRGRITLRSALAESRNIPAVKVLNQIGVDKMIDLGEKMGISSWEPRSRFGLSLTLGGGEITLYELATAYSTIANYGKRPELFSIQKITGADGTILYEQEVNTEQVLDERVAFQITDILRDNTARTPAFGSHSALVVPGHSEVAVKTGTSNDMRDNLTIGYNQEYLVAVWVGNNDNRPMSRISSGITGAAPIWNGIISTLLSHKDVEEWVIPDGLANISICGRREWLRVESPIFDPCYALKTESQMSESN